MLDLNVSETFENLEVKVRKKKEIAFIDPDTLEALLILITDEASITMKKIQEPPNPTLLETFETIGNVVGTVASSAAAAGAVIALVGPLCGVNAAASVFIKFMLIFKVIDRLKLLNIYFGPILTTFLNLIASLLNFRSKRRGKGAAMPDQTINNDMFYYTKTRGKLSYYKIDQLALYRMPGKYLLYIVSF